jgi:hypothetical protein
MYISRNQELDSALAIVRNFGGGLNPTNPLGTALGGYIYWIFLPEDRENWWAFVSKVMNI